MVAWSMVREEVFARDRYACQGPRFGLDPRGCVSAIQAHHIVRRSQGGHDIAPNLITLCVLHHRHVHDHPAWAMDVGLLASAHRTTGTITDDLHHPDRKEPR